VPGIPKWPWRTLARDCLRKVWRTARETALTPVEVSSALARRPYDLRHACASLMLNAGVPATEAARRLGHSVAMLLKRYASCIDGKSRPPTTGLSGRCRMAVYERLRADVGPLDRGPDVEAADQSRTSKFQASHDPGVTAAWRVRLVADGGGLENR